uniref:Aminotransferase-like plant mobile domain-containing protein n=1 Tax=Fagus sylvatica TaxID=28930 RepID=A0A2N9FE18_FAGSY
MLIFHSLPQSQTHQFLGIVSCYAHLFALSAYESNHIPTFEDWFNLFSDKERVRPAPHFLPFAEAKFTCPEMYLLNQGVNPLSSSLWAHVLQTRDLVILKNKSSGVEVYGPHFLARQFGLLQSIPIPPIFTANNPWHQRSVCINEDAEVIIVEGLSKISATKVEPFRIVFDALPLFTGWWEALMLSFNLPETLKLTIWEVCPHCLAYEIIGDVNTTSSEEEETVNARPLQTVLPSPKRSTRVKQKAAKKTTQAKKQPIKIEKSTRGKRKIVLSSSESKLEEQLQRKPKQQKVERKEKEVLEEEAPTQTKTSSCTQVFKRRSKGIVIKDSAVEKDLASALAKANQVIASQREEITALSIKAHQDVVSIITKEILVHLSSLEKKQKLAAEKERAIKIKQEQSLQVEAAMEAKKKAIQDEEEKKRLELERKQKEEQKEELREEDMANIELGPLIDHEEMTSSIPIPEIEEVIPNQLEVEADPLTVPTVPTVEETKEEATTPVISTPELEIIEQTPKDVDPSTALVLATLTPVDIEDLSELEVDQLIKRASSALEEMKSASKASTSSSSKAPASPVSQVMSVVVVMRSILKQPLDNLISTAMNNEKEIQSIQKGYDEKITAKYEFQQDFE